MNYRYSYLHSLLRKSLLMLPFLFAANHSSAQGAMLRVNDFLGKALPGQGPLAFFVVVSPEFASHVLGGLGAADASTRNYYNSQKGKFSYSAGWAVRRKLNARFSLQSGLFYSVKGLRTKSYATTTKMMNVVDRVTRQANYQTTYLEIPLRVNWQFSPCLYAFGGASFNIFLFNKMKYTDTYSNGDRVSSFQYNPDDPFQYNEQRIQPESAYHTVNPQVQLGVGTDVNFLGWGHLQVEPVLKLSLSDVHHGPVRERFFSAGLNLALALN